MNNNERRTVEEAIKILQQLRGPSQLSSNEGALLGIGKFIGMMT